MHLHKIACRNRIGRRVRAFQDGARALMVLSAMMRRPGALLLVLLLGLAARAEPPNILLILADDLARSDLAVYGHPWHETPHLDALAIAGLAFTDSYAPAPICSASRASLLTGKSPARLQFEFVTKERSGLQKLKPAQPLQAPAYTLNLPLEEKSIAEVLAPAGYTSAFFGKWHLNAHYRGYLGWSPTYGPARQGFRTATEGFGSHPYSYRRDKRPQILTEKGTFPEDGVTKRAIDFINLGHRRPWFLFLSHFYVHTPVHTPCQWLVTKYDQKVPEGVPNRDNRIMYAAFLETLDHYVGEVLGALDKRGVSERTLVVFTSDNGGHPEFTANGPLRGSKWNLYEGGVRVPLMMRWPGTIVPESICSVPVSGYDFLPTFAELAGSKIDPAALGLDGASLVPFLRNPSVKTERKLYWHFPYYHPEGEKFGQAQPEIGVDDFQVSQTTPVSAIRWGNRKLLYFYEDERCELYDLSVDPGEQRDLAAAAPEEVARLREELERYLTEVKARRPSRIITRK